MIIRQTKPGELPIVSALYADANVFAKPSDIKEWTRERLKKFPHLHFVCESRGGKIVGAISAEVLTRKSAIINDIVVLKTHCNRRIGERLMLAVFGARRSAKTEKVEVWVHWTNARAIPFYYRFGFRIKSARVTREIKGIADGEDIIQLTLPLPR